MSILSRLFNGSVQKTLAQMISHTDVIQSAIYVKLSPSFQTKYGNDRGLTIAAAVTNKLFAKVSPMHSAEDLQLAEQLAANIMKTDTEVKYASLMACRARMLFEAEKDTEDKMGCLGYYPVDGKRLPVTTGSSYANNYKRTGNNSLQ